MTKKAMTITKRADEVVSATKEALKAIYRIERAITGGLLSSQENLQTLLEVSPRAFARLEDQARGLANVTEDIVSDLEDLINMCQKARGETS